MDEALTEAPCPACELLSAHLVRETPQIPAEINHTIGINPAVEMVHTLYPDGRMVTVMRERLAFKFAYPAGVQS
jgi:hypothetical protein